MASAADKQPANQDAESRLLEFKRFLEPVLSKLMEHFASKIQQLEKRVECAEINVATEAARVQAELRAEQDKAVAELQADHEKAVAEMRREHTATVSSLGSGLNEVRTTLKAGLPGFEQKITAQIVGLTAAIKGEQKKLSSEVQRAAEQLSASTAAHTEAVLRASLPQVEARVQAGAVTSCGEARKRGVPSLRELKERGVTTMEAKMGGYTLPEIYEAGYRPQYDGTDITQLVAPDAKNQITQLARTLDTVLGCMSIQVRRPYYGGNPSAEHDFQDYPRAQMDRQDASIRFGFTGCPPQRVANCPSMSPYREGKGLRYPDERVVRAERERLVDTAAREQQALLTDLRDAVKQVIARNESSEST